MNAIPASSTRGLGRILTAALLGLMFVVALPVFSKAEPLTGTSSLEVEHGGHWGGGRGRGWGGHGGCGW